MSIPEKGSLLIAGPEFNGTILARSVILLCEHLPSGSFGLIVNKPLHTNIPEEIVDPNDLQNPNISIRAGGPIEPNQMMLLHTSTQASSDHVLEVCKGVYLGGDMEFLQNSIGIADGPSILICFGYMAWGTGLLENELSSGAWISSPASIEKIFQLPPDTLWQTLLKDMGGKYRNLSMLPEDPELN